MTSKCISNVASPPVAITLSGRPTSALSRATQPLDHRDIAPIDADMHLVDRIASDHAGFLGASIAMRGSLAAAVTNASSDRLMPGAMIPPLYAPR
jgi:hypothetical protein